MNVNSYFLPPSVIYILYKECRSEINFIKPLTDTQTPCIIDLSDLNNKVRSIRMGLTNEQITLLAKQSTVGGKQRWTESQIRDMVGAPSIEEDQLCGCGDDINICPDAYEHMTCGV
jgi:hypothetical protein